MLRAFCTTITLVIATMGYAQKPIDGFMVTPKEGEWGVAHIVARGETAASISHAFHVPASTLAEANMLSYTDSLKPGQRLYIPLSNHNRKTTTPKDIKTVKKLYYRTRTQEKLSDIATMAKVSVITLQAWNNIKSPVVAPGTLLQVGWMLYTPSTNSSQMVVREETPKYLLNPDSIAKVHPQYPIRDSMITPLEALYREQTFNEKNVVVEKASAGFFQLAGNAKGASSFAFHNTAAKGMVIRVKNIANGRVVFVKVLGPVPATKQYYGCSIGLSNAAKAALGVRESKAFVELKYAGY